jgi:hypothetical protein
MEQTQTAAEALLRLEEPFASKDVKWLVAATTKDGRKGRVTPYADQRAYTDRLNQVVTASGWTRLYTVHTISPVTRLKKDKAIQTGKVLITCVVTITGIGTHSGSGEEWAEDGNAMTSAEAQAFKRACSCFGLGRYFYNFAEMWVELDQYRQPKQLPKLPSWALPKEERQNTVASGRALQAAGKPETTTHKGPLDAGITGRIEGFRRELGSALFADVLKRVGHVRSARDIPNQKVQQIVLSSLESCARGMIRIREIAAELPEQEFYHVLDGVGVPSLNRIPNFEVFRKLGNEMNRVILNRSAA